MQSSAYNFKPVGIKVNQLWGKIQYWWII